MLISVTMLSEYLYCPRKLFLKKVLRMEEGPSQPMIKGTIRHQVNDVFTKKEGEIVSQVKENLPFDSVLQLYKNNYFSILKDRILSNKSVLRSLNIPVKDLFKQVWPSLVYESIMRAKNVHDFAKSKNIWEKELWDSLTPKLFSEVGVRSEKLKLKGIIDVIEDYSEYHVPVEIKTGKIPREGVWPGHKIQVGAYMMLLEEQKPVSIGKVRYLEEDETRIITMNPFLKMEITQLVTDVIDLITKKDLPPHVENRNKCTSCPFREQCYDAKFMTERLKASQ